MILSDNLAIVLYTSTKGHFGQKDLFKHTVKRLEEKIPFYRDFFKLAHIKISPGEEELGGQMADWLFGMGWDVKSTIGQWSHNSSSHALEYYSDMIKVMSQTDILKKEFVLFIEDDWLLNCDNALPILFDGVMCLKKNPFLLAIRIERDITGTTENCEKISKYIFRHNENYSEFGSTFTFQPTLVRSLSWYHALSLLTNQPELIRMLKDGEIHCELLATSLLKLISGTKTPFCSFDKNIITTTHIGEPDYE